MAGTTAKSLASIRGNLRISASDNNVSLFYATTFSAVVLRLGGREMITIRFRGEAHPRRERGFLLSNVSISKTAKPIYI